MASTKREHINVRVTTDVLAAVDAYASEQSTSRSAAVEALLSIALGTRDQEKNDEHDHGAGEAAALRNTIELLTNQLEVKDAQIAQLTQLTDQAQRLQARVMQSLPIAEEAGTGQARDGAEAHQKQPQAPEAPHDPQGDKTDESGEKQAQEAPRNEKRSFWSKLWG